MTYQINIIHPKAAVLLQNLAEIGLISIEENGHLTKGKNSQKEEFKENPIEAHEMTKAIGGKQFNYDDLPPVTRSLAGSLEAPDEFDHKKFKLDRLAKKYL